MVVKKGLALKYIVFSDVHLGHKNTPTKHICNSVKNSILTDKNKDADVMFINGDLFDRLLELNSSEAHLIIELFNQILNYCYFNKIKLRVLEGTPSHDWAQSRILVRLNDIRDFSCDIVYQDTLNIEYIESINKHILYIPDEWANTHEEIEEQIKKKLQEHNISKVDMAMLHGQFAYQLVGKKYTGFHFKEDYFLNLVRGYIHVGHYHVYSTFDRIIANGSLERLVHGEEGPKGYVVVKDNTFAFIENVEAYTYKTINVTNSTTVEKLDKLVTLCPKNSYIRLLINKDHPFNVTYPDLKLRYLDYNLKKFVKENASEDEAITYIVSEEGLDCDDLYVLENNIHQTLLDIIQRKYSLNSIEQSKLLNYIDIFKELPYEQSTV